MPAIATVTGRLDYAQDEAALLFRFAHARRAKETVSVNCRRRPEGRRRSPRRSVGEEAGLVIEARPDGSRAAGGDDGAVAIENLEAERDANSSPPAPSSNVALTFCDPRKTPLASYR